MVKHNPNYKHIRQTLIEDLENEYNDLQSDGDHKILSYGMNNYGRPYPTESMVSHNSDQTYSNGYSHSSPTDPRDTLNPPNSDQTYSDRTGTLESFQVNNEPSSCRMCDIYYKQHKHILFIMYIIIAFLCVLCLILINKIINSNK